MVVNIFKWSFVNRQEYQSLLDEAEELKTNLGNSQDRVEELDKQKQIAVDEIEEYRILAESYFEDKKRIEEENSELLRILSGSLKSGIRLSKIDDKIIQNLIPPVCSKPYKEKQVLGCRSHHTTKGIERFITKLSTCPYISEVKRIKVIKSIKNCPIREVSDCSNGYRLKIVYKERNHGVEFELTTTAKDNFQYNFIQKVIEEKIK